MAKTACNTGVKALIVLGGLAVFAAPPAAMAAPRAQTASLAAGAVTRPPMGWVQFCAEHLPECRARTASPQEARLDRKGWHELVSVNRKTNEDIEQVSDDELYGVPEYWTYPTDGKGDCEDIALEKKRRLIALGWPSEALLMTVVRDLNGDGHAVLMAKTDRGDYILDNNTNEVKLWFDTGYAYVKRQSQHDPNQWVSLGPAPSVALTSSQPR